MREPEGLGGRTHSEEEKGSRMLGGGSRGGAEVPSWAELLAAPPGPRSARPGALLLWSSAVRWGVLRGGPHAVRMDPDLGPVGMGAWESHTFIHPSL